ncbi:hypothetical protein EV175_004299, partial [Coemansia sp. RSA 1933]
MTNSQAQKLPSTSNQPAASNVIAALANQPVVQPQGNSKGSIDHEDDDENLIAESIRAERKLQQQRLASPSITQSPPSTRVQTPKAAPNNSLGLSYLLKEVDNQSGTGMADVMQGKQESVDTSELVASTANSDTTKGRQSSSIMSHPNDSGDRRLLEENKGHSRTSAQVQRHGLNREGSFDSELSSAEDNSKGSRSAPGISSPAMMAAAAAAVADAVARSNISAQDRGNTNKPISPTSISHQAQYTFSSPSSPDATTGASKHHKRTSSAHTGSVPIQFEGSVFSSRASPSMNISPTYRSSPSFSHHMEEEDVHMSESPSAEDRASMTAQGVSRFHSGNLSDSGVFRHHHGSVMQRRGSDSHPMHELHMSPIHASRSSTSPLDGDDSPSAREGVSMSAKSAILYHAGYNSGRGAVWRFFKV